MEYPRVYAITLNWNKKDDTIECVETLKKLTYPNYEIVVVDNGSIDGSAQAIKYKFPDVTVIENDENLGYALGFNSGIEFAYKKGADYFLILNNDTVIEAGALTELVRLSESSEKIGFVSGKVYYFNEPQKLQTVGKLSHPVYLVGNHVGMGEYDYGQYNEIEEYDFIDDVFLLVRREVYERVGGYDENFFLHWEETDWCARVRRAGFRILYTPKAKIWHKGLLTTCDGISASDFFYVTRNQVPFMWRNAHLWQFAAFTVILMLNRLPITVGRFAKNRKCKYIGPYLKGLIHGYLWILRGVVNVCPASASGCSHEQKTPISGVENCRGF